MRERKCSVARKRKPGGGNAGSDFFCYRSLRFQVCGLASAQGTQGAERFVLIVQPISFLVLLLSCSSTTLSNLTEPSASSQRFLLVCALTCPSQGRLQRSKTYAIGRLTRGISELTRQAGCLTHELWPICKSPRRSAYITSFVRFCRSDG